jgi:hypothetical protein
MSGQPIFSILPVKTKWRCFDHRLLFSTHFMGKNNEAIINRVSLQLPRV